MNDDLFSRDAAVRDFIFDGEVAAVFDDMLSRSIPFYDEIQRMAVELSCRVLRGGSGAVYDIGCSTGNTLMRLTRIGE
jgi:tRNA (cmo5U34)-methyltransferase